MSGKWDCPRGQSEVLGAILLAGIVIFASFLIIGLAVGSFTTAEKQTTEEAIERLLLEVRSASTDVAIEGYMSKTIYLDPPEGAEIQASEKPTSLEIIHHDHDGPDGENASEVLHSVDELGTLEVHYEGTTYALEGAGVFKLDETGGSLITPPNLALRGFTANLPILRLDTTGIANEKGAVRVVAGDHVRPAFPNLEEHYKETGSPYDNPVFNGTIEIVITGEFYEGWGQFFEQYTDGNVEVDRDNQSVSAFIESLSELTFDSTVLTTRPPTIQGQAASIDMWDTAELLPDNSKIIDDRLAELADENDNGELNDCADFDMGIVSGEDCTITAGSYFIDGDLELQDDLDIDTSDGDVVIGIDGDLIASGGESIEVIGEGDHGVEYYISGMLDFGGATSIGTENEKVEAHRNIIYLGGDSYNSGDGNMELDAVIFAPNVHLEFGGNPTIRGAIIAEELSIQGNANISIDEELAEMLEPIDVSQTATPIMYLHITENTAVIGG